MGFDKRFTASNPRGSPNIRDGLHKAEACNMRHFRKAARKANSLCAPIFDPGKLDSKCRQGTGRPMSERQSGSGSFKRESNIQRLWSFVSPLPGTLGSGRAHSHSG